MTDEEFTTWEQDYYRADPCAIPGPVDHHNASHWVEYNDANFTVETWCRFGPNRDIKLKTRVRPMCESEMIFSKTRGHSREAILKAFGVEETKSLPPLKKKPWYIFW